MKRTTAAESRGGRQVAWFAVVAALAAVPTAAMSQPQPARDPAAAVKDAQRHLELRQKDLELTRKRADGLQKSVTQIEAEQGQINGRLVDTAAQVQKSEAQLSAIESRLAGLEEQETALRGSLNQRYDKIAKLLGALQRMGRNPPPVMITRREDALKMVRSAMMLATAFPEMKTQALALADKLNRLVRVMTEIRSESDRLRAETTRLNDMRTRLASLMESKKSSLSERQDELADARRGAADIAKSVESLGDLIERLDKQVAKNAALVEHEAESQRQIAAAAAAKARAEAQAPAAPATSAPTPPASAPTQSGQPAAGAGGTEVAAYVPPAAPGAPGASMAPKAPGGSVVELAPAGAALGSPSRIKPAIPFQLAKGKLPLPAHGKPIIRYGEKTPYGGTSKGLVLETRASAQVTSPSDGWIVYSGEFRSYGQLLIINAGGGYHVLLAGLSQINVQPGEFVLAGEPVGTMIGATRLASAVTGSSPQGDVSQLTPHGGGQSSLPVLYIEFRKDGQPVDPDPWWAGALRKVQE